MNKAFKLINLISLILLLASPSMVLASNCGKVKGQKIVTYGGLSCSKAKSIYQSYLSGKIPDGWNCALSAGVCEKDNKGFTFRFN